MSTLGAKMKAFRLGKKMTLQQVANGADCTAAYLSQIENDKTSPSISVLKRISHVLGVKIVDFFTEDQADSEVVVEPGQWPRVSLPGWKADIRQMVRTVRTRRMQPFHTVIQPGGGTEDPYSHQGEEFGVVLEGQLTLRVGKQEHKVSTGSSFYYESTIPHSWTNQGEEDCRVVWVVTPPSW